MQNLKTIVGAAVLSTAMFASGAVFTSTANAQNLPAQIAAMRGERGSARNIMSVKRHLEALIDQLQRDQHDYNGYREKAIDHLQAARADLQAAINFDAGHPGQ